MIQAKFVNLLMPLKAGTILNLKNKEVEDLYLGHERKLAEYLQFGISEYCRRREEKEKKHIKQLRCLLTLCYSSCSVAGLSDPQRLTGSLAVIIKYLHDLNALNNEDLQLLNVLEDKRDLLTSSTSESPNTNLFIIHHYLIEAAVKGGDDRTIANLIRHSLRPLAFLSTNDAKTAMKISRNVKRACNFLGDLTQACDILVTAKGLVCHTASDTFQEFVVKRLVIAAIYFSSTSDVTQIKTKFQQEIPIYLKLTGQEDLVNAWDQVLAAMLASSPLYKNCLGAVKSILSKCPPSELGRTSLLLGSLLSGDLCTATRGQVHDTVLVTALYHQLFLPLWKVAQGTIKGFTMELGSQREVSIEEVLCRCCIALTLLTRSCLKHQPGSESMALLPITKHAFTVGRDLLHGPMAAQEDSSTANFIWSHIVVATVNSVENVVSYCLDGNESSWPELTSLCENLVPSLCCSPQAFTLPVDRQRISLLFDRWVLSLTSRDLWDDGLRVRAVQIATCPWDLPYAVSAWNKLKSKVKIEEKTFLDYSTTVSSQIEEKFFVIMSNVNMKNVLLCEAKAYNERQEPNSLILRLWSQLRSLKPTQCDLALGLSRLVTAVHDEVTPAVINKLRGECVKVLQRLQTAKTGNGSGSCVYEGVLQYALFVLLARERQGKARPDAHHTLLLQHLKVEADEKAKYGEDVDMNMTCDVMPDTDGLGGVEEVAKLLDALDGALNHFLRLQGDQGCQLSQEEVKLGLEYLHMIGNAAALYGDVIMAVRAYAGLYMLAHKHHNSQEEMSAVSKLALYASVSETSGVLVRAEQLMTSHESTTVSTLDQPTLTALLHLQLSIAAVYLSTPNIQKSRSHLEAVSPHLSLVKSHADFCVLKGRYMYLLSQLALLLPVDDMPYDVPRGSIQRVVFTAFYYLKSALSHSSQGGIGSSSHGDILLAMLEVSMWCADVYMTLLLTPYVRAFLEDMYVVCQRLGLVARTAQLLSMLVQVDVATLQPEDVTSKLVNLRSMLALPPVPLTKGVTNDCVVPGLGSSLALRDVSPIRCYLSRDKSPLPALLPYPTTHSHPSSCSCRVCQLPLLRLLQIETSSLEGKLSAMCGDTRSALEHYRRVDGLLSALDQDHWDRMFVQHVADQLQPLHSNYFKREVNRVRVTSSLAYALCSLLPDASCTPSITNSLLQAADDVMLFLLPARRVLITPILDEMLVCVWAQAHFQKPASPQPSTNMKGLSVPIAPLTAAKTPHVRRKQPQAVLAPVRGGALDPVSAPPTPVAPARIGRKIFTDTPDIAQQPSNRKIRPLVIFEDQVNKNNSPKVAQSCRKVRNDLKTPMKTTASTPAASRLVIFEDEISEKEKICSRKVKNDLKTPMKTPTRVKGSNPVASVKMPTGRRARRPMIRSDSEEDIPATPSPITKSAKKAATIERVVVPIIFPDLPAVKELSKTEKPLTKEVSIAMTRSTSRRQVASSHKPAEDRLVVVPGEDIADISKDLFESFEQKCIISDVKEKVSKKPLKSDVKTRKRV